MVFVEVVENIIKAHRHVHLKVIANNRDQGHCNFIRAWHFTRYCGISNMQYLTKDSEKLPKLFADCKVT